MTTVAAALAREKVYCVSDDSQEMLARIFGDTVADTAVFDLAVAVIRLAIKDASQGRGTDAASARRFLAGSAGLSWWCEVSGLDPESVIERLAA